MTWLQLMFINKMQFIFQLPFLANWPTGELGICNAYVQLISERGGCYETDLQV